MKSSNIQSINAWLHTYPDLLKLMKERKAWLEVIVSYEMPEASVTNQVRACLNNMNECPKMVHICHLPNVDVKLPKEVPQTFGSNRLVICPKDIQGRSDTFFQMIQDDKQTSVIIFINIAGIIHLNPSDSSRMGKLTAKNTCKNLRVDGKVREAIIDAAGKHWNKSGNAFGRSLGFWIKLPEPNVISDNFKGNMSELVERLTGKKTESTYKKREDDKKEKEKKQEKQEEEKKEKKKNGDGQIHLLTPEQSSGFQIWYTKSPYPVCDNPSCTYHVNGVTLARENKKLLACSACKGVKYCSKECQKKVWKFHKTVCKETIPDAVISARIAHVVSRIGTSPPVIGDGKFMEYCLNNCYSDNKLVEIEWPQEGKLRDSKDLQLLTEGTLLLESAKGRRIIRVIYQPYENKSRIGEQRDSSFWIFLPSR